MDLGMLAVLIHVLGDAINNIGVIIAACIIWFVKSEKRFYADPAVSTWIAIMILITAIPLTKRSGKILLQSAPLGVNIADIKHDLESIPGIVSVHELHVWQLDQKKAIASAHVVVSDPDIETFMRNAQTFRECLHAYGIHSATLQPELVSTAVVERDPEVTSTVSTAHTSAEKCGLQCGVVCEELKCCT
jgi:zinc transporter 1